MEQKKTIKKVGKRRYSDKELSMIKSTFSDNEDLLKAIRKVFLQMELTPSELKNVSNAFTGKPEVLKVVAKTFLPELDPEAPLQQIIDLWMTLDIKDKTPEQAYSFLKSRNLLISYLRQQLAVLGNIEGKISTSMKFTDFDFSVRSEEEEAFVNLLTRNVIITHTEQQIFQLQTLAGTVDETVEETMERLLKNSSK